MAASLLTKEFQQENGLPVTGMIDKETYEALKRKFA